MKTHLKIFKIFLILFISVFAVILATGGGWALPINNRPANILPVNNSLQDTLNSIMTNPWDVVNDQKNNAIFTHTGTSGSVASFVFTDWGSTDDHSFGIYEFGNASNQLEIFGSGMGDSDQVTVTFFEDGSVRALGFTEDNNLILNTQTNFGSVFGFYYATQFGTFYSEDDLNGGDAMALVYQGDNNQYMNIPGNLAGGSLGPDHWLFAFDGTDYLDYNDAVVLVESIKPVPEPATMMLLGVGLMGVAAVGRKKIIPKS